MPLFIILLSKQYFFIKSLKTRNVIVIYLSLYSSRCACVVTRKCIITHIYRDQGLTPNNSKSILHLNFLKFVGLESDEIIVQVTCFGDKTYQGRLDLFQGFFQKYGIFNFQNKTMGCFFQQLSYGNFIKENFKIWKIKSHVYNFFT